MEQLLTRPPVFDGDQQRRCIESISCQENRPLDTHKKRFRTIIIFSIIMFSMGCIFNIENLGFGMELVSYHGKDMDLYTVASYNVLGADGPGTTVRRIETDQFGRTLFEVNFLVEYGNWFYFQQKGRKSLYSYVISQKTEQDNVSYYEDVCWAVFEKPEDFTTAENAKLKEKNDWDKPIDEKRLTTRRVIGSQTEDGIADKDVNVEVFQTMTTTVINAEETYKDYYLYYDLLRTDAVGNAVYVIILGGKKDGNDMTTVKSGTSFFLLINEDGSYRNSTALVKIEDPLHYGEQLTRLSGGVSGGRFS